MNRESLLDAEERAREVALKAAMPEGWGFFLCLASYGGMSWW